MKRMPPPRIIHGTLVLHEPSEGELVWMHGDAFVFSSYEFLVEACVVGMVHGAGKVVEGSFILYENPIGPGTRVKNMDTVRKKLADS